MPATSAIAISSKRWPTLRRPSRCAAMWIRRHERLIFVLHQISELDFDPAAAGFAAVVFGHSHKPLIETREGVLYLNPGSAGPRRFDLPVAVARVAVSSEHL